MSAAGITFKLTGVVGLVCLCLAICTLWLVLTDPITVATAVDARDLSSLLGLFTRALSDALHAVVRYL